MRIQAELLAWYARRRRELPWRGAADPYAVWISEIMLQQTRVETVIPYYARWMARFPTVESLAVAPMDEVLRLWAGLGYYTRARNLAAAAQAIVAQHDGVFPSTPERVRALPGVGAYTAGAILSIAFGQAAPLVDGNVARVLSRLFLVEALASTGPGKARLWQLAQQLVEGLDADEAPGDFNQALMELGATVCLPSKPRCGECPLAARCGALRTQRTSELPRRAPTRTIPTVSWVAVRIERGAALLLVRRPLSGLWGGLWEFPSGEAGEGEILVEAAARIIHERTGLVPRGIEPITTFDHVLSHVRLRIHVFAAGASGRLIVDEYEAADWLTRSQVATRGVAAWMQPLLSSKNGRSHA